MTSKRREIDSPFKLSVVNLVKDHSLSVGLFCTGTQMSDQVLIQFQAEKVIPVQRSCLVYDLSRSVLYAAQTQKLKPIWKRKFVNSTHSKHDLQVIANVLSLQFTPDAPNQAWVADKRISVVGPEALFTVLQTDFDVRIST
jgi:hypothetical protein